METLAKQHGAELIDAQETLETLEDVFIRTVAPRSHAD
jgi:hypothetical protein